MNVECHHEIVGGQPFKDKLPCTNQTQHKFKGN